MTKLSKFLIVLLIVLLVNVFPALQVFAWFPPIPSSFYGTVKVNGENAADGTLVQALINGQVFATGYTQTYQGNSVYALDVPGDDSATTSIDGGRDNDVVQFMVGEVLAAETGVWKSATNAGINLTLSTSTPLNTPQPTPTAVPTQTPIKLPKKLPTATTYVEPAPTERVEYPTLTLEPEPTRTHSLAQVQPTQSGGQAPNDPAQPDQVSLTQAQPPAQQASEAGGSGNSLFWIVLIALAAVLLFVAGRAYWKSVRSRER